MDQPISAFGSYSWNRLVETLLEFKEALSKASRKDWDVKRWQEICAEMRYVEAVMKDPSAPVDERFRVLRRLQSAPCRSMKVHEKGKAGDGPPVGMLGTVDQIHAGLSGHDGVWIELPHVTFKTQDGNGTMRHRMEELDLVKEHWWFSPTQHKPKK